MKKVQTYSVKDFVRGEYKHKGKRSKTLYLTIMSATSAYVLVGLPKGAVAVAATTSGESSFDNLYESAMTLFDGAVVVMIVFCGAMWGLGGNRSQAIERIIAVGSGYILARHARDIQGWLSKI